jgi:uncharacterized BrkB/YihY/UPF0761 family membrane protein
VIRRKFEFLSSLKDIIAKSFVGWVEHDASTRGAALAFYTVFSIAPIISIAIGAVGLVVQGDFLRANLLNQTQDLLGASGVAAVKALLTSASYLGRNRIPTFIGIVTLLLGASSVFVELQNSLDRIWELPRRKRMSGLWRKERSAWADVWVGGLATAVLFNIGKFAIGIYLGKSAFASVYGVVGSFLVLLLWVYYSAQIFLLGAEFTRNYSLVLGARVASR